MDNSMIPTSELRIRIKIGNDEIEFQGPAEAVDKQFEPFRLAMMPAARVVEEERTPEPTKAVELATAPPPPAVSPLDRVVQVRGSICSLRTNAKLDDAILVILLGQRTFRRNENVSGREIMEGLRNSGITAVRADIILKRYAARAMVVATGALRRRRYRLSLDGAQRAEQIVRTLAAQMPPPETGVSGQAAPPKSDQGSEK